MGLWKFDLAKHKLWSKNISDVIFLFWYHVIIIFSKNLITTHEKNSILYIFLTHDMNRVMLSYI